MVGSTQIVVHFLSLEPATSQTTRLTRTVVQSIHYNMCLVSVGPRYGEICTDYITVEAHSDRDRLFSGRARTMYMDGQGHLHSRSKLSADHKVRGSGSMLPQDHPT